MNITLIEDNLRLSACGVVDTERTHQRSDKYERGNQDPEEG